MKEHGKTIIDMLSVEFTEEEKKELFIEDGVERGIEIGREQERERLNKLMTMLIKANRIEDLERSASDSAYQQKLLEEFGLDENSGRKE